MPKNTPDVSVIICTYTEERWADLVAAVESVQHQSVPPREIIVVVDHNPKLLEHARASLPGVVVQENKGMPGVSSSRNTGVAAACGALIAFLDDDATAASNWLEQLSLHYEDPKVLGVGGALEPVWLGGRPRWFPDEFNWVVGCTYKGLPEKTSPVRNLIAANMSVRREVFEDLGGFRKGFGKIGPQSEPEETELCIRALQRWPRNVWLYEPRAIVSHNVPTKRANRKYFLWRCYREGLGKASMVRFVGASDGLSSERVYVLQTLPAGFARGLADTFLRRDLTGLARVGVIVSGLAVTTAGYLIGIVYTRLIPTGRNANGGEVEPVQEEMAG